MFSLDYRFGLCSKKTKTVLSINMPGFGHPFFHSIDPGLREYHDDMLVCLKSSLHAHDHYHTGRRLYT